MDDTKRVGSRLRRAFVALITASVVAAAVVLFAHRRVDEQQRPDTQYENRALMTASLASAGTGRGRDEASIQDTRKATDTQEKWAYEQWYRAQIIRAYFGKHSAAHIEDKTTSKQTTKTFQFGIQY